MVSLLCCNYRCSAKFLIILKSKKTFWTRPDCLFARRCMCWCCTVTSTIHWSELNAAINTGSRLCFQSLQPQPNRFLNASSRMSIWTEESGLGFRRVWDTSLISSSLSVVAVSDVAGRFTSLSPLRTVWFALTANPSPEIKPLCNVHTPRLWPENLRTLGFRFCITHIINVKH